MNRTPIMLLGAALLAGCAGQQANPPLLDGEVIRLVTVDASADHELRGVTAHRGEGLAVGAAGGTLGWLGVCGQGAGSDPSGLGLAFCVLLTPVATVGGGLYGFAMADDGDDVAPRVAIARDVLAGFSSKSIATAVGARLANLDRLEVAVDAAPRAPEDLRIEIEAVRLHTEGLSVDSTVTLHLDARIRARDGAGHLLRAEPFRVSTRPRRLEDWVEGDPPLLERALVDLRRDLADEIVERWFLRRDVRLVARSPGRGGWFGGARVAARTPVIEWALEGPDRIDVVRLGVRYDFTLLGPDGRLTELTLSEPRYVPAAPLAACSEFQWSVRASWERYGETRTRDLVGAAPRFRTPCED